MNKTTNRNIIDQKEINKKIWAVCNTFRGVINPSEYKNYILTFLFIKYISDIWKDHYEEHKEQLGDNRARIQRKMKRERFILPDKCSYDYIYKNRNETNVGEIIDKALSQIEDANKKKLENVFRNISFNSEASLGPTKERNRRLKNLIEDFSDPALDFRPSRFNNEKQQEDVIGNAYIYLISMFASDSGKKGGEFYTPREVSITLAKLVGAKKGNRIYDPTCGSGSLLLQVANEICSSDYALYGQEINGDTWVLAKMNMFLHRTDNANIKRGDTINSPQHVEKDNLMKFDVVVANPPFSLDKWGAEHASADPYKRFQRGVPPKSKGDYAFILHMIESAYEDKGRVGVIVPHGVLFRGSSEGKIRKKLIDENLLDAVIGLPANLFFGTSIPASILIFNKGKKTKDIFFIDASREYEEGKKQNKLRDKDIEKIVKTYQKRKNVEKYAYIASLNEIKKNEYNLNIPRYVDTFEEEEEIDIQTVQKEIEGLEKELAQVRKTMNQHLKELKITTAKHKG